MSDPVAQVVELLQPRAPYSKRVTGYGAWRVARGDVTTPHYFVVLEGNVSFRTETSVELQAGDFVLCPAAVAFEMRSTGDSMNLIPVSEPRRVADGEYRLGHGDRASVRLIIGTCEFASYDTSLLVPLLPSVLVARGQQRIRAIVELLRDEALAQRPAREVMLERLLEILLIEALRTGADLSDCPGLLRGLLDERIAKTVRSIHIDPAAPWTVATMAADVSLSRSAFHERFTRTIGMPPMEYLTSWRLALAKRMLRKRNQRITEVAERVGYGSVSAFSVAFSRRTGMAPSKFAESSSAHPGLAEAPGYRAKRTSKRAS